MKKEELVKLLIDNEGYDEEDAEKVAQEIIDEQKKGKKLIDGEFKYIH